MMKVTANGKTFTFPHGTSNEDIGNAIDEYFAGGATAQKNQPLNQNQQEEPSLISQLGDGVAEAGRATLQAGANIANIPLEIGDAVVSAGSWLGKKLGIGDGTYTPASRFSLPDSLTPHSDAGKIAAEIIPYFVPVMGQEKAAAAIGELANSGKLHELAGKLTNLTSQNAVGALANNSNNSDDGVGLAKDLTLGTLAGGAVQGAAKIAGKGTELIAKGLKSSDDLSVQAASKIGRQNIANQAARVTPELDEAANVAGVDINTLTPGMRSGNRGLAQAEGALSSVQGVTQDAHRKAFEEITSKLNKNLDEFGSEAGNASQKSQTIKQRISENLEGLRKAESRAWDDVRATDPRLRGKLDNANAVVQSELSAGVPLSAEMKQLLGVKKDNITFDGMKAWRAKFADAEQKYIRTGEANAARRAGEVRRAITDDMRGMAEQGGFVDEWSKANELSRARFEAVDKAESVFGRDLANDALITNGVKALQTSAAKGLTGKNGFHTIVSALPENERVGAISSMLQDALSHGVRGGTAEGVGLAHIAKILTPQNVNAIGRYSPDMAKIMGAYGELARAAIKPQQYIERTGRTTEVLARLNKGLPDAIKATANSLATGAVGSIIGSSFGGSLGGSIGASSGAAIKGLIDKFIETRSGRYAIEKAIREAAKATRAGGTKEAFEAANKRLLKNGFIRKTLNLKAGRDATRAGIIATPDIVGTIFGGDPSSVE
jgi:hypothetical protein